MPFKLKLVNVHKYLELKGWNRTTFNDKLDTISITLDGEPIQIVIPKYEMLPDYRARIKLLIDSLSSIEDRTVQAIHDDILNVGYDVMKIRFEASKTQEGTIPLNDVIPALQDVKDMLTYGACSILNTKSQYTKPYNEASELIRNCEFAQTEIGSFVIAIRVPSAETYLVNIGADQEYLEDLGRKTITRLISGVNDVDGLNLEDEQKFREQYDEKLNKNVCVAISKLIEDENGFNLSITAKWDVTKKPDVAAPSSAEIKATSYKRFNTIAHYLKKIPEEKTLTITGTIRKMQRIDRISRTTEEKRLITVTVPSLKRNVHILLDDEEYKVACNAHRDVKNVTVTGFLNKRRAHWFLDRPKGFKVLD
ncbi:hypothetical protein HY489_02170 [Candidatus Woesearchaeota archaeon]|nr:hypothetical protein [Candidatus Woesearchaeota archaeon]